MMNLSGMTWLVDSNIIVSFFNVDSPFHLKTRDIFNRIKNGEFLAVVSSQNILEFSSVLLRAHKQDSKKVAEAVDVIFHGINFSTICPTNRTIEIYNQFLKDGESLHPVDLFLVATMKSNNIDSIITNDHDFEKIKGIKIFNPFSV